MGNKNGNAYAFNQSTNTVSVYGKCIYTSIFEKNLVLNDPILHHTDPFGTNDAWSIASLNPLLSNPHVGFHLASINLRVYNQYEAIQTHYLYTQLSNRIFISKSSNGAAETVNLTDKVYVYGI